MIEEQYYNLIDEFDELHREYRILKSEIKELEACLDRLPEDIYNKYVAEIEE